MLALATGESSGQIVRRAESDGVIISTARYTAAGQAQGLHYHENPHICLIMRGRDEEVRGGRSYERRTGDIFFYRAGELHGSPARTDGLTNALVEFTPAFLDRQALSEEVLHRAVEESPDARFLVMKLQQELRANDGVTALAADALILELVHHAPPQRERTPPRWVGHVAEVLHDRASERLSLSDLSALANAHPVTISKHFRRYFACTLGEYRRKLMIAASLPLIDDASMPLSEIAATCGFADQSHFTRTFQALTGFRPGEFRRF